MTRGRPFTDSSLKPNGRPFSDPTHPNYDWFNGGEKPEDEEELEDEKIEAPTGEETFFMEPPGGIDGLIRETTVEDEEVVEDPLVPTISGTDDGEKIKGTNKDDILEGGLGPDKFKVKKGNDVILDFQVGVDSLKGKFRDVEFSMVGESTLMEHKKGSILFNELELTAMDIFG